MRVGNQPMPRCVLIGALIFLHDGRGGFFADPTQLRDGFVQHVLSEEKQVDAHDSQLWQ